MSEQDNHVTATTDDTERQNRRDLVRNLGKFAVYAAPFTLLALKGNADAGGHGSGGFGGGPKSSPSRSR
jgi:hypothetical protein